MRIYVTHDGAGVQPGIFLESPGACFLDPQGKKHLVRLVEITEQITPGQMALLIRDSIYIVGYDRPAKGRRTRIIIPTSHIVSIQFPEAEE